jgi:hypothetical protein
MKTFILTAIKEWIINKFRFGQQIWTEIADEIGIGQEYFHSQDKLIGPERLSRMLSLICNKLSLSNEDMEQQFLEYWMTDFAPRLYQSYTRTAANTKNFMINITRINNELFSIFPNNPHVGRVVLIEKTLNTLQAVYANEKSLIDIIAVIRVVSVVFEENFSIKKINALSSEITFEKK